MSEETKIKQGDAVQVSSVNHLDKVDQGKSYNVVKSESQDFSMTEYMQMVERLATNPDVDVEKMNGILDLQERIINKNAEAEYNQAMALLQINMPIIKKDGTVEYPADKNNPSGPMVKAFDFATYENIMTTIKPHLNEHGFSFKFTTREREGGGAVVVAKLQHKGGHSETTEFAGALDTSGGKNNIQAMGSTYSYGKRYCVVALLNIIVEGEDNDGNTLLENEIDDAQFEEIQRLIDETDTDTAKFCGHLNIPSLRAMPQKLYSKATHDLKAKAKKIAAKKDENDADQT